ncbi:hypothetical protein JX266_012094 [Neoarthrinium moseri]|nr:hypothetical protein JX266_012094 [Neoarthrinium moseri]
MDNCTFNCTCQGHRPDACSTTSSQLITFPPVESSPGHENSFAQDCLRDQIQQPLTDSMIDEIFSKSDVGDLVHWKGGPEMDLDSLGMTSTSDKGSAPAQSQAMNLHMWPTQGSADSRRQATISPEKIAPLTEHSPLLLNSRLDRLESMVAQTQLSVVNVEMSLRMLCDEVQRAGDDQVESIEKLREGLDRFLTHVAAQFTVGTQDKED